MRIQTPSRLGIVLALAASGCSSWPGLDDPVLSIAPEYTAMRMSGKTRMESGTPPTRNARLDVSDLGAGDREDNVGVRLSYGSDTSGFDLHYNRFEAHSSGLGVANAAWGAIPAPSGSPIAPDQVDARATMDDFRARYVASFLVAGDPDDEDAPWLAAGIGVQLAHRDLSLDIRSITSNTAQKIQISDDVSPMLALRLAGRRGPLRATIDVAYNDDWSFGTGDLTGEFYDVTALISYWLEDQEITIFGGYRRFDMPARGHDGPYEFDTDFTFDGYVFGVHVAF